MLDRIIAALLLFAVIAAACAFSAKTIIGPIESTAVYAINTAVEQANQPLSPSAALDANAARMDDGSSFPWSIFVLLLLGILVGSFALVAMNYGEGFLKQLRLYGKSTKRKPNRTPAFRTMPRARPMLGTGPVNHDDVIIEGEMWQD